ncbi:hypothetical protein [Altericista sp. CCNU0014]|uniref:hypothetical protein n=1 Tax=Altericista sp. CCNU0014 TaxID=3082949 RepID=UPI0038508CA4
MKLIQPLSLGLLIVVSLASAALASPRTFSTQASPQSAPSGFQGLKQTRPESSGLGGPGVLRAGCPKGQTPSSWQKPIYDKNGLFVVGWETVATCIPDDLEPAG